MATLNLLRVTRANQGCFSLSRGNWKITSISSNLHFRRNCFQTAQQNEKALLSCSGKNPQIGLKSILKQSISTKALPTACGFDDYKRGCDEFELEIPEHFNFARDVIDKWADLQDQEIASGVAEEGDIKHLGLWWTSETGREYKWTFRQLSEFSKRSAYVLTGPCGLDRGDRLVVMLPTFPQYWLICLACIRAGIVFVPSSTYHGEHGLSHRLKISKAKCVITDDSNRDKVDEVIDDCPMLKTKVFVPHSRAVYGKLGWLNYADMYKTNKRSQLETVETLSDEMMTIHFTTGTTGLPKLVQHTHASYGMATIVNGKYFYDLTREDVYWTLTDTGWAKHVWGLFSPWVQGACIFAHHAKAFEPEKILQVMEKYPITAFTTSPPSWRHLVQEDLASYDLSRLRCSFSGGELLAPEVTEKWEDGTGTPLRDGYGQTETLMLTANFKCLEHRVGSLGKPVPGCNVTIVDNELTEVQPGEIGEIAVKVVPNMPPGFFREYVDDSSKTHAVFRGEYYLTGDMGYRDSDGYFWYVSRREDLIYSEGHVVSPFDVEHALMESPAIAECAVVSSPDSLQLTGQLVKAYVLLSDNYKDKDPEDVLALLNAHSKAYMQPWQVPKQYEFMDVLPTTVAGKLKRSILRKQEWHMHAD